MELEEFLAQIQADVTLLEAGELELIEYVELMKELDAYLEELKDENSSNEEI